MPEGNEYWGDGLGDPSLCCTFWNISAPPLYTLSIASGLEGWRKRPERVQRAWVWESIEQGWTLALPLVAAYLWGRYMHSALSECVSCSVMSDSLQSHKLGPARLFHSLDFPGKNTGLGCHSLLQGIFLTQGSSPGSPALQAGSLPSKSLGHSAFLVRG